MNENVGVTTDRRGKVRVEGDVERIVTVPRDVEGARAEILGAVHCASAQMLQRQPLGRVLHVHDRLHERAGRTAVEVDADLLHASDERLESAVDRRLVATEKGLIRQARRDLARDGDVGHEHEFLDELVRLLALVLVGVDRKAKLVESERDLDVVDAKSAAIETASTQLLGERGEHLDVVFNALGELCVVHLARWQSTIVNDCLRVRVGELDL